MFAILLVGIGLADKLQNKCPILATDWASASVTRTANKNKKVA